MIYIGVGACKSTCTATVKGEDGRTLLQQEFTNSRNGIDGFIKEVKDKFKGPGTISAVCGATGNYWYMLHDALEDSGIDAKVAHPAKTSAIAQARLRNDQVDSSALSDLLRAGTVHEVYVPDAHYRNLRTLARLRLDRVRAGTRCKNAIEAIMAKYDEEPPAQTMLYEKGAEWLRNAKLSDIDRIVVDIYLEQLALARKQASGLESEMTRACAKDERIDLLTSMPGISPAIAITIIAEVVDMNRFGGAEKLVSYAGLAPPRRSGGDAHRNGHAARAGSPWLRHAMVEAARTCVRHDKRMGDIYKRVEARQGDLKALVAVARHMLEVCWHMAANNKPYKAQDNT